MGVVGTPVVDISQMATDTDVALDSDGKCNSWNTNPSKSAPHTEFWNTNPNKSAHEQPVKFGPLGPSDESKTRKFET